MARLPLSRKIQILVIVLIEELEILDAYYSWLMFLLVLLFKDQRIPGITFDRGTLARHHIRELNLCEIAFKSDIRSVENIRMDRRAFMKLCSLLVTDGKLKQTKNMGIQEMVACFLYMLAHNEKNRVVQRQVQRSGETISRKFHDVLNAVLRLHKKLLKKPEPVLQDSTDSKWKCFKDCLGALDGTYIDVMVDESEKPRYRSRKGNICTNVLGVCSQDMQIIYVLPGWEGSAQDSRVLRSAISRRNGFIVPKGYYYLCDAGYTNGEGFLAPFRGQRYHLNEWRQGNQPTTPQEFFNMKHSRARNVIERCFGLLKNRWRILQDRSHYPVKTKCRIISACCLLQNYIRQEMSIDPMEATVDDSYTQEVDDPSDRITHLEASDAWSLWRENKATEMFNNWMISREQRH